MDTQEREELLAVTRKASALGKHIFQHHGYNSMAWLAMVLGEKDDDKEIIVSREGVPPGHFYEVITEICQNIPFEVKGICLIMDTFILSSEDMDPEEAKRQRAELRAGDLSRRFDECDPLVKEALSVLVLTPVGSCMISAPYRYTPVEGWEWLPEHEMPEDASLDWEFNRVINGLPRRDPEVMQ